MSNRKLTKAKRPRRAAPLTKRSAPRAKLAERQKPEKSGPSPASSWVPARFPNFPERTRVVLLPVNPYLIHAYWEVTISDLGEIHALLVRSDLGARVVLRFYDLTGIIFESRNTHSWFDVEIDLRAGNWYVHLWSPERSYVVELGIVTEAGRFYPRARSNVAETPRVAPSLKAEERYLLVRGDYRQVMTVPPPDRRRVGPSEMSGALPAAIRQQVADTSLEPTQQRMPLPPGPSAPAQINVERGTKPTGTLRSEAAEPTDITAMNERGLVFGLSSGKLASPERMTDETARTNLNRG